MVLRKTNKRRTNVSFVRFTPRAHLLAKSSKNDTDGILTRMSLNASMVIRACSQIVAVGWVRAPNDGKESIAVHSTLFLGLRERVFVLENPEN